MHQSQFLYGLEILRKDVSVRKIFKKRLLDCSHKPQGFFDKLLGNISWDSYNECMKCDGNNCVIDLDDKLIKYWFEGYQLWESPVNGFLLSSNDFMILSKEGIENDSK